MALTIIKALKKEPSIKLMVHKKLAGYEKARDDGEVHASDLMKELEFCPREWALRKQAGIKPKDQFIGTAMRITFTHGRDMEYRMRNEWLREHMVGRWECNVCGHEHTVFGKAPKISCPKCGKNRWEYKETNFKSPTSGVTGGIDAIVDVGAEKHRILEIKSIDKDQFKELVAPLAEHKLRTTLYLRLAHESHLDESNKVNTQEAHILYVSKSFGFKDDSMKVAGISDAPFSPFKEYVVKRDDALVETYVQKAIVVKAFIDTPQVGMPCGVCSSGLEKRAQACSVLKQCWNGTSPSQITWMEKGKPKHLGKKLL